MALKRDPATGLPTDEAGNIIDPSDPRYATSDSLGPSDFTPDIIKSFADLPPPPSDGEIDMTGSDGQHSVDDQPGTPPDTGAEPDPNTPGEIDMESPDGSGQAVDAGRPYPGGSTPSSTTRAFGVSQGESHPVSAYTPESKKYASGAFGAAERKADAESGAYQNDIEVQRQKQLAANESYKRALDEQAGAIAEHQANLLALRKKQMEFDQKRGDMEMQAMQRASAEAAQYMGAYKQDINGMRSLILQTGNPYVGMSPVAGTAIALGNAVQGFLGARYGINVNVAGQIDKIVDREMESHQQMIQNMGAAAQQQLTLGNWARQNASDETEARLRANGFVMDAMKAGIYMEAARYQSATAHSDAAMKAAEIDKLQATNDMALRDKVQKQRVDIYNSQIDAAAKQATAAARYAEVSSQSALNAKLGNKYDSEAEKNKEKTSGWDTRVPDPITGAYIAQYDKNAPQPILTKAAEMVSKASADFSEASQGLVRLRNLYQVAKEHGLTGNGWLTKKKSKEGALLYQQMQQVIAKINKADSGLSSTDAEYQRKWGYIKDIDSLITFGGDRSSLIENLEAAQQQHYDSVINNTAGVQPMIDPDNAGKRQHINADPGGKRRVELEIFGAGAGADEAKQLVAKVAGDRNIEVAQTRTSPGSNKEISGGGFSPAFHDFATQHKDLELSNLIGTVDKTGDAGQTQAVDAIDEMARNYLHPEEVKVPKIKGQPTKKPDQIKLEMLEGLQQVGAGTTYEGKKVHDAAAAYADEVVKLITQTPPEERAGLDDKFTSRVMDNDTLDPGKQWMNETVNSAGSSVQDDTQEVPEDDRSWTQKAIDANEGK